MTTDIEVRHLPAQRFLVKRITCAHHDIGPAFGRTIGQVGACMKSIGATMTSAPLAIYLAWRESDCDMAVGCMVSPANSTALINDCEWHDLPGGPSAFATHVGPYATLRESHIRMQAWCELNQFALTGPCYEIYTVDPGLEPDTAKWQTDIYYPIAIS